MKEHGGGVNAAVAWNAFWQTPKGKRYQLYHGMTGHLDEMIKSWLDAPTAKEAAQIAGEILEYKDKTVEMLDNYNDSTRSVAARKRADEIYNGWYRRQNPRGGENQ